MSNRKDHEILRELAKQVAEIAALPVQQEKIEMWKSLNHLQPTRPMVLVNAIPWNEMAVDDELNPKTSEPFHRELEMILRRTLYRIRH